MKTFRIESIKDGKAFFLEVSIQEDLSINALFHALSSFSLDKVIKIEEI